jgi:hypothetical protein
LEGSEDLVAAGCCMVLVLLEHEYRQIEISSSHSSIVLRRFLPLRKERGVRQRRTCDGDKLEVMGHRRVIYQSVCNHCEYMFLAINLIASLEKNLESGSGSRLSKACDYRHDSPPLPAKPGRGTG